MMAGSSSHQCLMMKCCMRRLTIIQQDSLSPLTVLTLLLFNHRITHSVCANAESLRLKHFCHIEPRPDTFSHAEGGAGSGKPLPKAVLKLQRVFYFRSMWRYTRVSAMRLCAIVWLVVTYCSCSAESVISGPFPQNVTARINSTVEFTCSVNTSELTEGTFSLFGWNKDGVVTSKTSGVVKSSTLTLKVTEENLSGVVIQCRVILEPLSQIPGGNATLITYGTIL